MSIFKIIAEKNELFLFASTIYYQNSSIKKFKKKRRQNNLKIIWVHEISFHFFSFLFKIFLGKYYLIYYA